MSRALWIVYTDRGSHGVLFLCEKCWRALQPGTDAERARWDRNTFEYGGRLPCDECKKRGSRGKD
ncbi:MAG: hypothetical protein ABFE07_06500 [Armatimonadia bacterium]